MLFSVLFLSFFSIFCQPVKVCLYSLFPVIKTLYVLYFCPHITYSACTESKNKLVNLYNIPKNELSGQALILWYLVAPTFVPNSI